MVTHHSNTRVRNSRKTTNRLRAIETKFTPSCEGVRVRCRKTTNRLRAIETLLIGVVDAGALEVARQLIAFGRLKLSHPPYQRHDGCKSQDN